MTDTGCKANEEFEKTKAEALDTHYDENLLPTLPPNIRTKL